MRPPWPSLLSFVRLVSNPRVFERPVAVEAAWRQVEEWLDCEPVWIPQPIERHREVLGSLLRARGLVLCSADGDFARFAGLRWENPLPT